MQLAEASQRSEPKLRLWKKAEYYEMARLGWFAGQRVELIEGEVMVLSPQKFSHYSTTDRTAEVLRNALGKGFWVRVQGPIDLGTHSEPEPDVSVVSGSRDDYSDHPSMALLVVEVSDTTLASDRSRKASLYARAGFVDYWIVNLVDHRLEVYRNPAPDDGEPFGYRYCDITVLGLDDWVSPLTAPQTRIRVADLLV
jgi:Uma2 family endonuclease